MQLHLDPQINKCLMTTIANELGSAGPLVFLSSADEAWVGPGNAGRPFFHPSDLLSDRQTWECDIVRTISPINFKFE